MKKSLTIMTGRKLIEKALDISAVKLEPLQDCPGVYFMQIGNIYIEVSECEHAGFEDYYQLKIGFFPIDSMTFLYCKGCLERNMIAESELKEHLAMLEAIGDV